MAAVGWGSNRRVWYIYTDERAPPPLTFQRTVLQNLKEVLELSGSSLEKVVKYNVYLADMKDFAAMNEVYIDFLPKPMPSRSCLQALPPGEGTVIEIECIAQA